MPPSQATGGVLDRIGDLLYDPLGTGNASVDIKDRIDVPRWLAGVQKAFSGHKPGDKVDFTWYGSHDIMRIANDPYADIGDHKVTYTLGIDGKWRTDDSFPGMPDINKILSGDVSYLSDEA